MADAINLERRRFLWSTGIALAAGLLGISSKVTASDRRPRELAAISRATEWINSPPLTLAALLGKVVLVDFWTYTSINCLRTLPFIRAWAEEHKQQLVVLGVHTPEFPFERSLENVRHAVRHLDIPYPVVVDNDNAIWRAFHNQSWPEMYLLDAFGGIRQHQVGERDCERLDRDMRQLLSETDGSNISHSVVPVTGRGFEAAADWTHLRSPKTYIGYGLGEKLATRYAALTIPHTYVALRRLALNEWALAGRWTKGAQGARLSSDSGQISYRFHARDVHLVMGPAWPWPSVRFRVTLDGQPPGVGHGLDVDENGNGVAVEQRLYQLIRQPTPIVDRTFAIEFLDPGIEAFTVSFG